MRPRYYIQRNEHYPESDLWVEMEQIGTEFPKFHLYGNFKGHPTKLITMSVPTANRLAAVVKNFNTKILDIRPDWKTGANEKEVNDDDQSSDTERFAAVIIG